ncbi:MAG: GNVR domain-containing protein [Longimicrobiales bacterium]
MSEPVFDRADSAPEVARARDATPGGAVEPEISLLRLVSVPLKHLGLILALTFSGALLALLLFLVGGTSFTASSTFQPKDAGSGSRLAGLAVQFGFPVPASMGEESAAFYAELLESHELLYGTAAATYAFAVRDEEMVETVRGTLIDLYEIEGDTPAERERAAIMALDEMVTVEQDPEAGLVTLRVTAPWRSLAVDVNRRMLDLLNTFNLEKRQSQAAQEREFVEVRMEEAQAELLAAEEALERFLQQNRTYTSSPQLVFEAARLQRRIDLQQEVYTSLVQAYEQARIEEVRNTPVITVIDGPERNVSRAGSGLLTYLLLSLVLGGMVGIMCAFVREYVSRTREERPEEYEEFVAARRDAVGWLRPSRLLHRRRGGSESKAG